jgi:dienelactone hydrolase
VAKGYLRWKIEKEGFENVQAASFMRDFDPKNDEMLPANLKRTLDPSGSVPSGMVRIPGIDDIEDYYIDRFEVTNRQFKEFMDNGGYLKKEYWKHPFIKDGRAISWERALREFVDKTGRQGPSTWVGGNFPDGQEDYPVSGVSWYEAAAYAENAGKRLPTIHHWKYALGFGRSRFSDAGFPAVLLPLSKFGGDGPSPVGSHEGISLYGVYDMVGNVREWCWNESYQGRCLRGTAWSDPDYTFPHVVAASAFDRSEQNGFRCVWYPEDYAVPEWALSALVKEKLPDYRNMPSISDDVFASLKERFFYDESELNPKIEMKDDSQKYWSKEKATFAAAYGNERAGACIYLPRNASPPYQTIIFFPGSGAWFQTSSEHLEDSYMFETLLEFIVKDGRAVVYPIYKGLFERSNPEKYLPLSLNVSSYESAEYWIQVFKDFRRTLDYLETRSDIDMKKIVVYSYSWGFLAGTILPAIEERLAANVIVLSGMTEIEREEINPINYVRRVKIPTLLISGEYDSNFSLEQRAKPLFDLLGTPEDQKHHVICESDHFIQKNIVVKDVLWFLDKYLEPVRPAGQNQ